MEHTPDFEPRTAVVTGSDSGIGRATAYRYLSRSRAT